MSPERPSHPPAVATALFVTLLWSSSWILIRWGLDEEGLAPITFAALRYGAASVVLVSVLVGRRSGRAALRSLGRTDLLRIGSLGVVLYAVTQGAQFVAIDNQPAATTSLVLSLTPLLVGASAVATLGEIPSARQVVGGLLVAAGAWSYVSGDLGATAVGMAAAVVGLLANAAASILGRQVNRSMAIPPLAVTAIGMAIGSLILVPAGLATEGLPAISARAWLIVSWLAVVNTALAFTLWNRSLRRLSAIESAGINNTMLVQIALLAWLFLGERPGAAGWAGVVLVAAGVSLTQFARPVHPTRPTTRRFDSYSRGHEPEGHVDADQIERILNDAEDRLRSGGSPDLGDLGFWKVVSALKRDPGLRERFADRAARIDRDAFTRWAFFAVPVWVGTAVLTLGTAAGLVAVWVAYDLDDPWNGLILLLGSGILLTTLHGLAHLVVGWLQGMRFTHWFIGKPTQPQPGVKVDYASYLRVPARRRAWMHASGAIATKVVPFAMLGPAVVMDAPWWTTATLAAAGAGMVLTDALWSVHVSDWKKFRREMRFARDGG